MATWVCPNDRQLALRAKLGTGWSVHTPKSSMPSRCLQPLTGEETSQILVVIKRAEKLDQMEMQRVGTLVERLEKLKIHSQGDGRVRCGLCGERFSMLGASPNLCHDCSKNICNKCGLETFNSKKKLIYLCKLCSEKRELWRKSGAWFYKGLPPYARAACVQRRGKDNNNNSSFRNKNLINNNNNRFMQSQTSHSSDSSSVLSDKSTYKREHRACYRERERRDTLPPNANIHVSNTNTTNNNNNGGHNICNTTNNNNNNNIANNYNIKADNKNDFYYDHYKYRPSFLINATSARGQRDSLGGGDDDDYLDECANMAVIQSDNELDMVTRLQNNRKAILNNKNKNKIDNNNNDNNSDNSNRSCTVSDKDIERKGLSNSPPKNFLSLISNKEVIDDNDAKNNNNNNNLNNKNKKNAGKNKESEANYSVGKFTHYIRSSKRFSTDDDDDEEEEGKGEGREEVHKMVCDSDDVVLNVVCKKVKPKESESDTSSYENNQLLNRSSDLSANHSITHSSDRSTTSSASINQLHKQPDASINQLRTHRPLNCTNDLLASKTKARNTDLLPLHIPANFQLEEDTNSVPETPASLGVLEFSLHFISKDNLLRCHIHRAKNLPAMDKRGLCDSFVRTHLLPGNVKATKRRTRTLNGSRSPEWNEVLEYQGVFVEDLKKKDMRLSILDEDTISDKFIGETIVSLKNLGVDFCKEYSVYLSGLQVIGEGVEKGTEAVEAGRIRLGVAYEEGAGRLVVTVHRCVNLLAMDSNGFSDPYVKIYLKPPRDRKTKRKTRVKMKTLNPEFNEEFTYRLKAAELASKTLEVSVWDKDIGSNDFIGKIVLGKDSEGSEGKHWMDVLSKTDHVHTYWHILKHS